MAEPLVVASKNSVSSLSAAQDSPEERLEWDNDVKFHISRQLLHLRRYRNRSQVELARAIGTSQSAIARIESGEENPTLDTVERIVVELGGRFDVSIPPAERSASRRMAWWNILDVPDWTLAAVAKGVMPNFELALLLLQRPLPGDKGQLLLSEGNAF